MQLIHPPGRLHVPHALRPFVYSLAAAALFLLVVSGAADVWFPFGWLLIAVCGWVLVAFSLRAARSPYSSRVVRAVNLLVLLVLVPIWLLFSAVAIFVVIA